MVCTNSLKHVWGLSCPNMIDPWVMDDGFDADEIAENVPPFPNTCSDGRKIQDPSSKIEIASGWGLWTLFGRGSLEFEGWGSHGYAQDEDSSRVFSSILVPLQIVQRAELSPWLPHSPDAASNLPYLP